MIYECAAAAVGIFSLSGFEQPENHATEKRHMSFDSLAEVQYIRKSII